MNASTAEAREQHKAQIAALTRQKQRLESRFVRMHLNKLDGNLDEEEYRRFSNKFRSELTDLKFNLEQMQASTDVKNVDSNQILELAQKAAMLYSAQIFEEKRKLLNSVCSNSTWAGVN